MAQLSPREADVARLVALGMQTKNVAHKLGLSDHTVVNHLRNIYTKLGVHRRAELARLVC
jgi:DNA-binding CsgD family transcriptional regulator